MSWLRNLIDGNQSSLDVLPVTCLCEFLLNSYQEKGIGQESSVEHEANSHRAQYKRKQHSKVFTQLLDVVEVFFLQNGFCLLHQQVIDIELK